MNAVSQAYQAAFATCMVPQSAHWRRSRAFRPAIGNRWRASSPAHAALRSRNLTGGLTELIARAGLTHTPACRSASTESRSAIADSRGARRSRACHAVRHAFAFQEGRRQRAAARAAGRAAVRPFRDAAAQHRDAPCSPSTTSTSPTGTTRATSRSGTAASVSTNMSITSCSFLEAIGAGRPCGGGVPALRRRAGRGRRDGAGRSPGAAAQHDA